ncbi:Uma2 family endonuclease [Mariniblastus sp.]|nr:Uma2 family endonuclease [Mariniblastus sp.]
MSNAKQFQPHYTVEDYRKWEGDWELWCGSAVAMSPSPRAIHQDIAFKLARVLADGLDQAQGCSACRVLMELDWEISSDTIVRPDVLITCQPLPEQALKDTPEFIAEILSPSTARKDLVYKRAMYQEQKVPYYAIVDPDAKTVELLTLDDAGEYQSTSANDATLTLTSGCEISLDLTRVFG